MHYFVANFKANIAPDESAEWLAAFQPQTVGDEIIVCPSFLTLPYFRMAQKEGIRFGSQDVSRFAEGAYTGEVTVGMLEDAADYVLVGHSERKKYFGETVDHVAEKLARVSGSKLGVILCLISPGQLKELMRTSFWSQVNISKLVLVYEPASAISGGADFHPDSKENIATAVDDIKAVLDRPVLYGGSVTEDNIADLIPSNVSGVLVGQKSLDPAVFSTLIERFPR